ncbi:MAG: sodium/proline symporter, partial [Candidatus Poseidoniales archaeon]|nr:sodium/proline symporter [Candidatus Poseidoniales archaeon]
MDIVLILSFLLFMSFFAAVGLSSMRVKKDTTDDYLVAGRGMHPGLAALSAVSTWNSGYMFIGFIGFVYLYGYSAIWISVISMGGQVIAWVWMFKFIQHEAHDRDVRSLSSLVGNVKGAPEAKAAAILSVVFLSIYAAAQLTAGGVALNAILGWSNIIGILLGFVLVVAYCYAGGIRASIWTDAAQSCVMIIGTGLLCWVALGEVGGFSGMHTSLETMDPTLTSMFPPGLKLGVTLWVFAFFLGGLGVAGQPQVVSRIMTLGNDADRKLAAVWFFVWQTPFIILMYIIGLTCRVVFDGPGFEPEMGLPMIAMEVLGPFWVGLILASIFAATMSTADSQVLACTAAVTDDIRPEWSQDHKTTKLVTLGVALFATAISLVADVTGNDSVFNLVVFAVYGLASVFIPLLLIRMMGYKPDTYHSMTMIIAAFSSVVIWRVLGLDQYIFDTVPGMGAAFIAHLCLCHFRDLSDSAFLGRVVIPRNIAASFGAGLIVILLVSESLYFINSPNSSDSMGGVDDYLILGILSSEELGEGSEYVMDGDTLSLEFNTDSIDSWDNGDNVVAVRVYLSYSEDETTSNGLGCAIPGASQPDPDTITGTVVHNEYNGTGSGQNQAQDSSSHEIIVEWYNSSLWNAGIVSNLTESEIHDQLDAEGAGFGIHSVDITVDVGTGGGPGCLHT